MSDDVYRVQVNVARVEVVLSGRQIRALQRWGGRRAGTPPPPALWGVLLQTLAELESVVGPLHDLEEP